MDQFDKASELETMSRDKALAFHRSKMQQGQSLTHCADCAVAIPTARRLIVVGVKTCVDCQIVNEKKGNLYAR